MTRSVDKFPFLPPRDHETRHVHIAVDVPPIILMESMRQVAQYLDSPPGRRLLQSMPPTTTLSKLLYQAASYAAQQNSQSGMQE